MDDFGSNAPRDDIYSKAVRAGKRTYFFDVKSTRSNELYLTITESKRRFNQQTGKFFYEKHKLFLYREDFEKFKDALEEVYAAIDNLQGEIIREEPEKKEDLPPPAGSADISFEDLGDTATEEPEDKEKKEDLPPEGEAGDSSEASAENEEGEGEETKDS